VHLQTSIPKIVSKNKRKNSGNIQHNSYFCCFFYKKVIKLIVPVAEYSFPKLKETSIDCHFLMLFDCIVNKTHKIFTVIILYTTISLYNKRLLQFIVIEHFLCLSETKKPKSTENRRGSNHNIDIYITMHALKQISYSLRISFFFPFCSVMISQFGF